MIAFTFPSGDTQASRPKNAHDNPVYRESAAATELLGTRWVTCAITGVRDQINVVNP